MSENRDELPDVRPGDVWKDRDKRGGPTVVVQRVCDSDRCPNQAAGEWHAHVTDTAGKRPRTILLRRFRPVASDYDLVSRPSPSLSPQGEDGA